MSHKSLEDLLQAVGSPVKLLRNSQTRTVHLSRGSQRVFELERRAARVAGDVHPLQPVVPHDGHVR